MCQIFCVCGFIGEFALATRGLDRWLLTGDKACTHLVRVYTSQFCQSACGETRHVERILSHTRQNPHSKHSQPTSTKTNNKNQRSATNHLHKISDTLPNVVLSPKSRHTTQKGVACSKSQAKQRPHKQLPNSAQSRHVN